MNNIDQSLDKVLPHNLEAEKYILGSILLGNNVANSVLEILSKGDFYNEAHRKIFSVIVELSEKNESVDLITLSNSLKDKNLLDSVGGTTYLGSLVDDNTYSSANIVKNAKIVKDTATLREMIRAAEKIINDCNMTNAVVDEVLDRAENKIIEISKNRVQPCFYPIRDIVKDSFRSIEGLYSRKELITGVPTGFEKIDDLTHGLQKSDLIIIAGRPGMGKTTLALNIAQFVTMECQIPVAIFSLYESKEELAFRLLASESKVESQRLRIGFLGATDWPKLTIAAGRLSEAPLFIDDTPGISVSKIAIRARRLKDDAGLGLIIVDYIQLMQTGNHKPKILKICHSLKALAKELEIPIVVISKLNHRPKDRPDYRPQIEDLRETDAFEQEADVIAFIYRDDVYNKSDDNPEKSIAEIIVAKHRNGPTGIVKLAFMEKFMSFNNLTRGESTP